MEILFSIVKMKLITAFELIIWVNVKGTIQDDTQSLVCDLHKSNDDNPLWLQLSLESLSPNAAVFSAIQSGCFWMLDLHSTVCSMKHGVVE